MAFKAPRLRVSTYVRNVGRSFGYAVGDAVGEYAPTLKSIKDDTKSIIEDTKMSSGEIAGGIRTMIKEYKDNLTKNTLDDLKSGNWYNKKREEDALNDMFGGFDFDFDDDDSDFNFDDDSDDYDSSDDTKDTRAIINSMGDMGEQISKDVAYSNARSAEYIVANQKASTRAMYELTGKGFNQVSNILLNMSSTMSGIASLGEPLSQHVQNSSVFYTKTTETLNKISESLDKLLERTSYMDQYNKKVSNKNKKTINDIFSGGEFSLSSYFDMVKDNIKEQTEMFGGLKDMLEMMGGKNGKNLSLAQFIPQTIVKTLIPNFFKETLKQLNEGLNNALTNGLVRGGKALQNSSSLILSTLGQIFFPNLDMKKTTKLGKYDKGPMQWDGEAKRALVRVIPDYLAKIYGALSGDTRYYDTDTGKYQTIREINKQKDDYILSQAQKAGGDFRREAFAKANNRKNSDKLKKGVDTFIKNAIMNDNATEAFYMMASLEKNDKKKYNALLKEMGIDKETGALIVELIRDSQKKGPNKNRNMMSNLEREIYYARNTISDEFRRQESTGGNWTMLGDSFYYDDPAMIGTGRRTGTTAGRRGKFKPTDYSYKKKSDYTIKRNKDNKYTINGKNYTLSDQEVAQYEALTSDDERKKFLESKREQGVKGEIKEHAKNISNIFKKNGSPSEKGVFGKGLDAAKYIWNQPFYAVHAVLDNFNRGITELFWGDDNNKGIIDRVKDKITEVFDSLKKKFGEFTKSLKDKFKDLFPQEGESLKDAMKREAKGLGNWVLGRFSGTTDKIRSAFNAKEKFLDQYKEYLPALGDLGSGTGSGLIKKIPNHHMSSLLKKRYGRSSKSGTYSLMGGLSGGASKIPEDVSDLVHVRDNLYRDSNNKHWKLKANADPSDPNSYKPFDTNSRSKAVNAKRAMEITGAYKSNLTDAYGEAKDKIKGSVPVQAIGDGAKTLGGGLFRFLQESILGDTDPEAIEKQKQNVFNSISKTMKDLAPAKGAMGIGAIGGVGVSLLTGALVGPIAGAAIGAGIGLATKSQAFQDFLFGKGDPESDEYTKGLLGGFGQALKADGFKTIKDVGLGAGVGAAAGTLMGSPIVGALIGSTAGFVAGNKKAQEKLFGDFNSDDPKTIRGKIVKTIKDNKSNIAAGMIAGLVAGPFGIVGNMILGSGIGMLSTTQGFKDFMFGNKDKGIEGLTTKIHDRIVNPLDDIMHNLAYMIRGGVRNLFDNLMELGRGMFEKTKGAVKNIIDHHPLLDRLAKGATNVAKKAITAPVEAVGWTLGRIDRATMKGNLKRGYNVYNRDKKRAATAGERIVQRGKLSNKSLDVQENPDGTKTYYEIDPITGKRRKIREGRYNRLLQKANSDNEKIYGINSKYGNVDQAMAGLSDAEINSIFNDDEKLNQFIDSNADKFGLKKDKNGSYKNSDINNIKSLFKDEYKGRGLDKKEEKAAEATLTIEDYVKQIKDYIIFGKKPKPEPGVAQKAGEAIDNATKSEEGRHQEMTLMGPVEVNEDGIVNDDAATSKTVKDLDKFKESIFKIPIIGTALSGISAGLSKFGKFLFGDKEGDGSKGLLGSIFGAVGAGASGLIKLITGKDIDFAAIGSTLKGGISKLITKDSLSFAAKNLLGPALLALGFGGAFDSAASAITGDAFNQSKAMADSNISVTLEDGTVVNGVHKEGNKFVDKNGNIINNVASVNTVEKGRKSLSDSLKYNTARGVATGTSSVASKVIGGTNIGKALTKNGAGIADDIAQKALRSNIITTIRDVLAKVAKLPIIKNLPIDFDGMANALSKKISKALSSGAAKNLAKAAAGAVSIARIAFIGIDFSTGYQDARSTLGITAEPTTGQRIISGLLRVIKNCIPIVGTLVPDELVVDVFCDYVAPALGVNVEELKGQRQQAQEEVDAYNAEHGTDYSVSDYNKKVLGDYTWTEKIGNKASEVWENAKLGFKNIGGSITKTVDKAKNTVNLFKEAIDTGIKKIHDGDIKGYWDVSDLGDEEMGGVTTALAKVGRFVAFPVILFKVLGNNIKKNISAMVDGVKKDFTAVTDSFKAQVDAASKADIKGLLAQTVVPLDFLNDPLAGVFLGVHGITTPLSITIGAFKGIGNKIKEWISPIIDSFKTEASGFSTAMESLNSAAKAKDLKALWSTEYTKSTDGFAGTIFSGAHFVMKVVKTLGLLLNTFVDGIKNSPVGQAVSGVAEGAKNVGGSLVNGVKNIGSNIFNVFHKVAQANDIGGSGSGFVSQFDPRYQNYQVSGSSFAGKGCGPAVASMTASALGKNLPVSSAVLDSRGYQVGNGVTLDYFQKTLGSRGINTEYIAGSGAGDLYSSIASGKKVVLLGQDRMNTSKAYSPFGPNNHYVVATGLDRSGNVIVNDPELNRPATYSPGILNSVKYGVAAGRSGLRRHTRPSSRVFRRLAGGASYDSPIAQQVWAFFKSKGFSDSATAGIMGNLYAESGMNPEAVQKGSQKAAGIAQWEEYNNTSGDTRWTRLYKYAKSAGTDWKNLNVQLNFLLSELETKDIDKRMRGDVSAKCLKLTFTPAGLSKSDGMSFSQFKNINDVALATRLFEAAFERAGVVAIEKRITAAVNYYNIYSGKQYTYEGENISSANVESASSEGEEQPRVTNLFSVMSTIGDIFSKAFTGAIGGTNESSTTGSTTEGYNISDTISSSATGPLIGETIPQIKGGKAQPHPEGRRNAASVVDIARSQLGVTEAPENITDYGKFTGTDGKAWCAAFASWVFDKAFNGDKDARNKALHGGISASVGTLLNNFNRAKAIHSTPQPGDLAIYRNGTSHVGIVEDVQGNQVYTIEGNTSGDNGYDRNGGTVYRKHFDYTNKKGRAAKLTGFGRPDWSAGAGSGLALVKPSSGRYVSMSGGASNLADMSRNMLNEIATSAANNNKGSGVDPELIAQLLSAITNLLNNIADNTAPVNKIYQALVGYLEAGGSSGTKNDTISIKKPAQKVAVNGSGAEEIDSNIKALVATLSDLAKG